MIATLIGCLDDDTVNQLFIAAIVPGPGPLTAETTDCVLAGLHVIDPRAMLTAGLVEDESERVFFGSIAAFNVSIACLTDEEWERAAPASGISDQDRAGLQCLMAELGGPGEYADAQFSGHTETIGQRMERDLDALLPLPSAPYDACDKQAGRVSSLSLVRYRANDYSVPVAYEYVDFQSD